MRTGSILQVVALAVASCAFALLLSTCGGKQSSASSCQLPDGNGGQAATEKSLDEALAELDAYPCPEGVDEALFEELKDALASQLESRFSNRDSSAGHSRLESRDSRPEGKIVSAPPIGDANKVTDLAITDNGDGTYTLSWHYRNSGDYDQNSIVDIADITQIAMHYGESYDIEDEDCLLAVIDGSGNGAVDIADITPLAMNYSTNCEGYRIQGGNTLTGSFTSLGNVSLQTATGDGRLEFNTGATSILYLYSRVVPYDWQGKDGEPSDAVLVPGDPPEIVSVSPISGMEDEIVQFSAEVTGSGSFTYAWDFGGGAEPGTSSLPSPTVTLGAIGEYQAQLTISNPFGQDLFEFTLTVSPAPPEILSVTPTEGIETYEAQFSAEVTGTEPFTYAWDFGGGAVPDNSEDATPTVTLGSPGEYSASMTVANDAGDDTYPFTLSVEAGIAPEITEVQPLSGFTGSGVTFSAVVSGTPPLSYTWDFQGAVVGADTSSESPTGAWGDEGEYGDCSLTVTNAFGDDTYLFTLAVVGSAEWVHTWGADSYESGEGVAVDGSRNVYVAGTISDSDNPDIKNAYLLKYSPDGILLWRRAWGGADRDYAEDVCVAGGDVYVVGLTYSFGAGYNDVFLLKYSPNGELLWQKTWGSDDYDSGRGITADGSGNLYVAGSGLGAGGWDVLLLKYTPSGELLWRKTWGGDDWDWGYSVAAGGSGDVYVAGRTWSFCTGGEYDAVLLKYDANGSLLWQKTWGGSGSDSSESVTEDGSGNVYVTGVTASFGGSDDNDLFLLKYSPGGDLLWQRTWGSESESGNDVAVDGSGVVYVAGTSSGDLILLTYSPDGDLLGQKTWSGSGGEAGYSITLDGGGGLYLAGHADNAYGSWGTASGTVGTPAGSELSPTGIDSSPTGTEGDPSGNETVPEGVEDEGGGGLWDVLVMKV